MDISKSCKKCKRYKTCWVRWNLVEVTNTINEHPSEVFTISGSRRKLNEFRDIIWSALADRCNHYNPYKEKYA